LKTGNIAFIGLGSNLVDPIDQVMRAFLELEKMPDTRLTARSSLYRSAAMVDSDQADLASQPDYVNAVAKIETELNPRELLQALLQIEHQHGRERTVKNAPRTLDLDLLLYDNRQVDEHGLTVPHPQIHLRAFVLQPLLEIAPDIDIPGLGQAQQFLQACMGQTLEKLNSAFQ